MNSLDRIHNQIKWIYFSRKIRFEHLPNYLKRQLSSSSESDAKLLLSKYRHHVYHTWNRDCKDFILKNYDYVEFGDLYQELERCNYYWLADEYPFYITRYDIKKFYDPFGTDYTKFIIMECGRYIGYTQATQLATYQHYLTSRRELESWATEFD